MTGNVDSFTFRRRTQQLLLIAVIALGVATSVVTWHLLNRRESKLINTRFRLLAQARATAVQREFEANIDSLHSVAAFYAGSEVVNGKEFRVFTEPLLERRRSMLALEWAPRIPFERRRAFEESASRDHHQPVIVSEIGPAGRLKTASTRDEHFPVAFLTQSATTAISAVGFDHASDPPRRTAMQIACDHNIPIATELLNLFRLSDAQPWRSGVLVALPVFANDAPISTVAERRQNLLGFLLGVYRMSDVVESALGYLTPAGIDLQLVDVTDREKPRLLHTHWSRTSEPDAPRLADTFTPSIVSNLALAGRLWQVHCAPTQAFIDSQKTSTSTVVLFSGILLTAMLASYLALVSGRAGHVQRLVRQRTAELQDTNDKLAREIAERRKAEERIAQHAAQLLAANDELTAARRQLDRTVSELERKNTQLDEFNYVASHDLQEPLRKLVSFSHLLQKDLGGQLDENEEAARDVQFIVDSAQRMRQLVQDLLTLSRAGRSAMRLETLSLEDCLDAAIAAVELRIEETGAEIIRDPLPTVRGDRTLLTQLFQNLLANALKFRADRPPVLRVTAEQQNDTWVVGIQDNGIGMKPEYTERIFRPFQRLHGRGEYEGTGVGLSICSKAVERHRGRIWVDTTPGEGAHFQFSLPIVNEGNTCSSPQIREREELLSS